MQRHVTSVFSDYEPMQNNSTNSKQLQYWLKQISHPNTGTVPTFGYQWNFVSNQSQSSYQERNNIYSNPNDNSNPHRNSNQIRNNDNNFGRGHDEISFGKTVNSSVEREKQNNSFVSNQSANNNNSNTNFNISFNNNQSNLQNKNKSYVNAMLALQKKVKTLQDQNIYMRKNLSKLNEQRNRSMSQSCATEEQLKSKLKILQPKVIKIDQLIQENKTLRETKEEKNRKIKTLQKKYQDMKINYERMEQNYEKIIKQVQESSKKYEANAKKIEEQDAQIKKLYEKNKLLQQMKQKSTVSILQKYNKSVELTQQLQKDNVKLKNQIQFLKNKHSEQIKAIEQNHSNEIKKCQIQFEKLKENINLKQSLIQEKKKQAEYFRDAYEKKDQQFIQLIRSQHKLKQAQNQKEKQMEKQKQKEKQKMEKKNELQKQKQKLRQKQKQNERRDQQQQLKQNSQQKKHKALPNSQQSSIVQIPQTLMPGNKTSFAGFDSEEYDQQQDEEEYFNQSAIPAVPVPIQTKSVGKPIKKKKSSRKGILSSQSRRAESKQKQSKKENMCINKISKESNIVSPQQHRRVQKKKKNNDEDASFTMKSCQPPKTQPMHKITFEGDFGSEHRQDKKIVNSYFYTAQYPPLPYRQHPHQEIQDFHCKNNMSHQSQSVAIDEAMLMQLQKELLQLYEEQQNLILASNDEYATQAERSQFVGRLKQLNEHLRIKNLKICELKSKL